MEMNRQDRKKSEERAYAEMLLGPFLPNAVEVLIPAEAPDVLLPYGGRVIGIEVTELEVPSSGPPNRLRESMEDFITREALRLAKAREFPPLTVSLFFNMADIAPRKKWESVAQAVVDAVQGHIPEVGGQARLECSYRGVQPREVDLILLSRDVHAYRQDWRAVRASSVLQHASGLFQSAMDQKQPKYSSYREKCDECWLILGVEGRRQSGAVRPDEGSLGKTYASAFDRVFFVRRIDRSCYELKVQAGTYAAG